MLRFAHIKMLKGKIMLHGEYSGIEQKGRDDVRIFYAGIFSLLKKTFFDNNERLKILMKICPKRDSKSSNQNIFRFLQIDF